tara:strand:- start:1077 stop:1667 length:591 start_codon:yes stop_codon:yes gene_type:complete
MKQKHQKVQLFLLFFGFLLILLTYFYYPNIDKSLSKKDLPRQEKSEEKQSKDSDSEFTNVTYKGIYDLDKEFIVSSKKARIFDEEPDIVYMKDMHVILYLTKGRIVNIYSEKGRYNKATYDCFFEENVKATDGETKIFADNLDLLATKNVVEIYNNVNLENISGSLQADKVDYNFETKYFKVSMFNDETVKMKVIK